MCRFLRLGDFFIGKPGPGSISEALAMQLPVILPDGPSTMVHERQNVAWVLEQGVGVAIRRLSDLPRAIEELRDQDRYREMVRRIRALNNRAGFEIPEIIEEILKSIPGRAEGPPSDAARTVERRPTVPQPR